MHRWISLIVILLFAPVASARVFDFSKESLAPYFNIEGGYSSLGQDPYYWQTPASYQGDPVEIIYGGEFGVLFRRGGFGFSLGALVTTYQKALEVRGLNSAGTELFSVDSSSLVFAPKASLLFQFQRGPMSHWEFSLSGGYQYATIENAFTMTGAGTTATGLSSYTDSYKSEAPFAAAAITYEFHLSGTATMALGAGYHHTFATSWNYGEGGSNLAGTKGEESEVRLEDGSVKAMDWSYPFVQIGFRFYIDSIR